LNIKKNTASFERKVLQPVTLSNGQVIPPGVLLEISSHGINHDESIYPNPNTYDGLRFYRQRGQQQQQQQQQQSKSAFPSSVENSRQDSSAAHNQFVSVTQNSLTFGYGRHACPGRFFAANEIKMILARAVLTFDIRVVGEEGGRYPNLEVANAVSFLFSQLFLLSSSFPWCL
jgi:cytochrome P450